MRETVGTMLTHARRQGIEAAILFIPTRLQVEPGSHESNNPWIAGGVRVRHAWLADTTQIQRLVSSLALDYNVPFLDLTPVMRESARAGNVLYYPLDGHWNSQGHRLAALEIAAWLERERVYSDN